MFVVCIYYCLHVQSVCFSVRNTDVCVCIHVLQALFVYCICACYCLLLRGVGSDCIWTLKLQRCQTVINTVGERAAAFSSPPPRRCHRGQPTSQGWGWGRVREQGGGRKSFWEFCRTLGHSCGSWEQISFWVFLCLFCGNVGSPVKVLSDTETQRQCSQVYSPLWQYSSQSAELSQLQWFSSLSSCLQGFLPGVRAAFKAMSTVRMQVFLVWMHH